MGILTKLKLLVILTFLLPSLICAEELILNGTGMRKASIFKVSVYKADLYLEKKSTNPDEIINSIKKKRLDLNFVRDVSKSKINKAWQEGLESNYQLTAELQTKLDQLKNSMTNINEGDKLSFIWNNDIVTIKKNNLPLTIVKGSDFSKALMSIWLGSNPPNDSLKTGLLGK